MNALVPLTLFGWPVFVFFLFAMLPARRAVLAAFILAVLFLPVGGYRMSGFPEYNKVLATSLGVLLSTLAFDVSRFTRLRLSWLDAPMIVWCLTPFATSISNGLGVHDGLSGIMHRTAEWCLPYLIGRLYITTWTDVRELAIALFLGGLIYIPFTLYEIKMSPSLHRLVYGFAPFSWNETSRGGGWRPAVFMQHGLMLSLWMGAAAVVGVWLWRTGALPRLLRIKTGWLALALAATAVLCKSTGASLLMALGLAGLFALRRLGGRAVLWTLVLLPPTYIALRTVGGWDGAALLSAAQVLGEERTGSLKARLDNEVVLGAHALKQPLFGWGGWGRNRVVNEETGEDDTITDSMWIIALGINGMVGLAAMMATLLVPAAVLIRRLPTVWWSRPEGAAAAALAMVLVIFQYDSLSNAMINPLYVLTAGGLTGLLTMTLRRPLPAVRPVASRGPAARGALAT